MTQNTRTPIEVRLCVLNAIDHAPGTTIRDRIKEVSKRQFANPYTNQPCQFTWRTISTWVYRFKKHGITTLENKSRSDCHATRKVQPDQLAEALNDILPSLRPNKGGIIPKSVIYRILIQKGFFSKSQLAPTSFYRIVRNHQLLEGENANKLRQSFAMQFANELWQADTLYGPSIKQPDGSWRKTFLIAFIDDASRVITHAEFFYHDNTQNMIDAFRTALFKRGKPERLYFDNGSNYASKEILQACLRLDIKLSHAPVRDGAAKGKIERFFRGFRDRFLTLHLNFESLDDLNLKTSQWIENEYNSQYHSGIMMAPADRFKLDFQRIKFLNDDAANDEIFFVEEKRKVSKTNLFSINSRRFECPVDLREKAVQIRYDRSRKNRFIVYFNNQRMGEATPLDLHHNANSHRKHSKGNIA
jgi:putative transposase